VCQDRFVLDRDRITGGGATATLDLMLHLIRSDHGDGLALDVAGMFIYDAAHLGHDPPHPSISKRLAAGAPAVAAAIGAMERNVETPLPMRAIARHPPFEAVAYLRLHVS
jgi:transcriptional regulator GlxA family with amidase domain